VVTTGFWLCPERKKTLISPAEMSVFKSHLNHSAAWLPVELGSMALRHQVSLVLPFSKIFLLLFSRLRAKPLVGACFAMV